MRIALITDGIYPYVIGGMQKHSFYLAKYFALNGIEVDLYHTAGDPLKAASLDCFTAEEKKYIHSVFIPFPTRDKLPGHYIREMKAYSGLLLNAVLNSKAVDFIYIQGLCGMQLPAYKKRLSAPVGINFHGLEMFQPAADFRSRLEQYLFKRPVLKAMKSADVVFSLGSRLSNILEKQGIAKSSIRRIAIGIDDSWLNNAALNVNAIRRFVFIGRYERRKGIEELTEVIRRLLPAATFEFDLIGAIPAEKRVEAETIRYHGSISDVEKIKAILCASDVLVCPSYSEGMPTVILEAMASGLAVIASDVGAVSEQVNAGNGMLVSAGNTEELEQAISAFINMPAEELLVLKTNSVERIRQSFLWSRIMEQTITCIRELTGNPG